MNVFRGFEALPVFRHAVASVGSFDGVHRGHQALLQTVREEAVRRGGESIVLTFEPHPRITLGRAEGLRLLTTLEEKIYLLEKQHIDNLIVIPFDTTFSRLSADEFVGDCLVGRVGVQTLVTGFDHRFGHDRQGGGDSPLWQRFGLNFKDVAECDMADKKISSTAIRNCIAQGDMRHAKALLGHSYVIIGRVENNRLYIDESLKQLPPNGNYKVSLDGQSARLTVAEIGEIRLRGEHPDGKSVIQFIR